MKASGDWGGARRAAAGDRRRAAAAAGGQRPEPATVTSSELQQVHLEPMLHLPSHLQITLHFLSATLHLSLKSAMQTKFHSLFNYLL